MALKPLAAQDETGQRRIRKRDTLRPCVRCGVMIKSGGLTGRCLSCAGRLSRRPSTVLALSEGDAGWLAGMIDGDGYVVIHKRPRGSSFLVIGIANTEPRVLDKALRITGVGSIIDGRSGFGGKRLLQHWRVWGVENVRNLLEQLRPHLVLKLKEEYEAYLLPG